MYRSAKMEEEAPNFVKDIASRVSSCVDKRNRKELLDILKIIHSDAFEKYTSRVWIYRTEECELMDSDRCKEIPKEDGFYRKNVRIDGMQGT